MDGIYPREAGMERLKMQPFLLLLQSMRPDRKVLSVTEGIDMGKASGVT